MTANRKTWWVAARLCRWEDYSVGGVLGVRTDDGSVGFLRVFPTREEADAAANGAAVYNIKEAPDDR